MPIGLFFGSFNPVHIGHLALANYMVEFTDLEEIWFVVSPHNPLKEKKILLDDTLRLQMMQSAVAGDKRFRVSDVEFNLPRPSYTMDTMTFFTENFPGREFVLIMGSDGLETFHLWKDYRELTRKFKRYIYPRSGSNPGISETSENCTLIEAPLLDISSTLIRQSIAQGKDMRYFVPQPVWNMIVEKGLYR